MLKDEQEAGTIVPEEHIQVVRERIVKYSASPEKLVEWSEVQKMIDTDEGRI